MSKKPQISPFFLPPYFDSIIFILSLKSEVIMLFWGSNQSVRASRPSDLLISCSGDDCNHTTLFREDFDAVTVQAGRRRELRHYFNPSELSRKDDNLLLCMMT